MSTQHVSEIFVPGVANRTPPHDPTRMNMFIYMSASWLFPHTHTHKKTLKHTHTRSKSYRAILHVCMCSYVCVPADCTHARTHTERHTKLVALLRKETCDLRHPMHLRHPVLDEQPWVIRFEYIHVYIHILTYISTYIYLYVHMYVYKCVYKYTHKCVYIHIYIHIYIYTYLHTQPTHVHT